MTGLSDELLERALMDLAREELDHLPSDKELQNQYQISKRFDRKIVHLIRDERRAPWMRSLVRYAKRAAVFFLALLIAAGTTIMTVSAAREWFFKVISQMFPTHTELQYGPTEESQEDEPFVAYAPSYIPEGYELKDGPRVREQTRLVQIGYKGSGSRTIRYTQSFDGGSSIDTEGSHTETVELNGRDALYIQKEDTKMLYRQIDNAMFWLYVRDPDLAKDDVLKIADSIAPLEE